MRITRIVLLALASFSLFVLSATSFRVLATPPGGLAARVAALEADNLALRSDLDSLSTRVVALENLLVHVSRSGNDLFIDGANLHVRNGTNQTLITNGLGNVIIGYNEERLPPMPNDRTGSHMLVLGEMNNFTSFGGIVGGTGNTTSGDYASVIAGFGSTASGTGAAVLGGAGNTASGLNATVSGGEGGEASGLSSSIAGGRFGTAVGEAATVSGGLRNRAGGNSSSVAGGTDNRADAGSSSVLGGFGNSAEGFGATVAAGAANRAVGLQSSVTGGDNNRAEGDSSSISGGQGFVAPALGSHPDTHRP